MKLVLASRSAARRSMLEAAEISFDCRTGPGDEEPAKARFREEGLGPRDLASALAEYKALDVAADQDELVLGADQTLELPGAAMLDKPGSREEAEEHLRLLSGRTHWLHSAAVAVEGGAVVWSETETVALAVRQLSRDFITRYLDAEYEHVRSSVGGYRIEGPGVQLFERIEGSHFAILGLPLLPLLAYLRHRGAVQS